MAKGHTTRFESTRWTLILHARDRDAPGAHEALGTLCRIYWYPLYAYIRRWGHAPDDAQDLTQGFFARFLQPGFLARVDPTKGKFRAFLLASCRHYLADERDQARAEKRGGGRVPIPIDRVKAESRYAREPAHEMTAESLFERHWAIALLENVLDRLADEMRQAGKAELLSRLEPALLSDGPAHYRALAAELGMSEGAVKVAVHRLRRRYRALLRDEIARTLVEDESVDDEIRELFAALARPGRGGLM